jgi:hypothetical protein
VKTDQQMTREQEAYERLREDIWETHSEPARGLIHMAQLAARMACMERNCWYPGDYEMVMESMRSAAARLTDREHKLLAKVWRAALAAAASVDPEDFDAGYKVYAIDLHDYYRMISGMVERTLWERRSAEISKEIAGRKEEDFSDTPF